MLPTSVFLDQHGGKGTSKLKTRVLDALGLQGVSFSEASGCHLPPLAIAFTLCLSRKTLFRDSLGKLAIAFPPCLSRKRRFQGVARRPKSAPFRMILGTSSGSSRSPFEDKAIRRPLGWACFDLVCFGKLCFPTEASPADPR